MATSTTIFISYIHEDDIAASALKNFLKAKMPVEVFVAGDQLRLGDEWLSKIRAELKAAKVVLALFSPAAIERPWVNFEAGGAWFSDDKTLIPICIGDLSPANLPKPYSNIQGVSLDDDASGGNTCHRIVMDLWKLLEIQSIPPPPFDRDDVAVRDFLRRLTAWKALETFRSFAQDVKTPGEE